MRQALHRGNPPASSCTNKDNTICRHSITNSWLHNLRIPGEWNHKHLAGNSTKPLRYIIGPCDVRVVGTDRLGNPRPAI